MRVKGSSVAWSEWSGRGDAAVLAVHATGFCKEVWEPVASELARGGTGVVAIDQRGHGSSPPPEAADWWLLGEDAAAAAAELGPFRVGLGHSSGATALTMAALLEPSAFAALVLIEPVVFPPGSGYDESLTVSARQRRDRFSDRSQAREHFTGRGIFAGWEETALDGYLAGGLTEVSDGVALSCPPDLEAEFYEMGTRHGVWDRLDEISVPTRILVGANSTYHRGRYASQLAARYGAELTTVPNTDHFLPMQDPPAVVAAVTDALRPKD